MKLVIVESPTKAKTLSKILGKDYQVVASMGHVRDLPKSGLGIDVEHNFEPTYEVTPRAKKTLTQIKKLLKDAEEIYLATDPDREGEAIAWHILAVLSEGKSSKKFKALRVTFHEITDKAVKESFKHTRILDQHLIDAQQARRVLDRLVGYKLSPLLWKKVRYGLSAGRVQSVAVRLVVERELERNNFVPQEYWSLDAELSEKAKSGFTVSLFEIDDKKAVISDKESMDKIIKNIEDYSKKQKESFTLLSVEKSTKKRNTYPPFMTSTLQQAASNKLGFTSKRTMSAAQALFEAGLITYHRTDSLNVSPEFLTASREFIEKSYGKEYLPEKANVYKTKSRNAQEAHEAIRPTNVSLQEVDLGTEEKKLYNLIWSRAIASQMTPAVYDITTLIVKFDNANYKFKATGSKVKFDGWLRVYGVSDDEDEKESENAGNKIPALKEGSKLSLIKLDPKQHFTEPPPRYTEASLIKILEENGIGRPSTYAPTISTIQDRGYITKEGKALKPEDVAMVVTKMLTDYFPGIVDYGFTAKMEENLDKVAEGAVAWAPMIKEFYDPFSADLASKDKDLAKKDMTLLEETEEKCPDCGKNLNIKLGKFGRFLSCSGFPDCKYAKPIATEGASNSGIEVDQAQLGPCELCDGTLSLREGRFGKFLACTNYPKCKFTKPYLEKIGMKCPLCQEGDVVVKKGGKFKKVFYGCSKYPDCTYISNKNPLNGGQAEETKA